MAPKPSAGSRARLRGVRNSVVPRLPAAVADRLRRALRPVRNAVQEPNLAANSVGTLAAAIATNEAGVVGLSQELARLAQRVDALQRSHDELSAVVHRQAEVADSSTAPLFAAETDGPA